MSNSRLKEYLIRHLEHNIFRWADSIDETRRKITQQAKKIPGYMIKGTLKGFKTVKNTPLRDPVIIGGLVILGTVIGPIGYFTGATYGLAKGRRYYIIYKHRRNNK